VAGSLRREVDGRPGTGRFFFTIRGMGIILAATKASFVIGQKIKDSKSLEDAMKVSAAILSLALAGLAFASIPASARQDADKKEATSAKKETKWQGTVARLYSDKSMMDLRGGPASAPSNRKVAYDDSTQWTKGGKPGKQEEVKEGSFVIVLGKVGGDGVLHASRIDLRQPR